MLVIRYTRIGICFFLLDKALITTESFFMFLSRNLQISKQTLQVYLIYFIAFLKVCGFHGEKINAKKENPQGKLNFHKVN